MEHEYVNVVRDRQQESRQRGRGCVGALVLLLVLLIAVCGFLAYWGILDRAIYDKHLQEATDEATAALSTRLTKEDERPDEQRVAHISVQPYVYEHLSEDDQVRYALLLDALQTRKSSTYPETTMDDLARIRDCVLADHPELFAVTGVRLITETNRGSDLVTNVLVSGQYSYSADEEVALQAELDAATAACVAHAPTSDDFARALYVYEYLANQVEYDHESAERTHDEITQRENASPIAYETISENRLENNDETSAITEELSAPLPGQTVIDALVRKRALCAGYARAFSYLMNRLGISCVYITGTAEGEEHAWCAALLDGSWYLVDPTWGDPQYHSDEGTAYDVGRVDYDYLCVTDADLEQTHRSNAPFSLPACTSNADNYYVHEGLFLTDASPERVGELLEAEVARGRNEARMRCANREIYERVQTLLFDEQEVYKYIKSNQCRYSVNDRMYTLELFY